MASVFDGSGSAFGGGAQGRSFGQFRLTNKPEETDFGKYLAQLDDPITKASLGMRGYAQNDATQRQALDTYRQFLAEGGASPALLRAFRNKEQDLASAYAIRQAETGYTLTWPEFLAEVDAQGSHMGFSPYEGGRQQQAYRIRTQMG